MKQRKFLAAVDIVLLLGLISFVIYDYYMGGFTALVVGGDTDQILTFFRELPSQWLFLILLIITIVEVVVAFVPGFLYYPLVGIVIGPVIGSVVVILGNVIGSIVNWIQGKILYEGVMDEESKFLHKLESKGAIGLFLLRLNPFTSWDFLAYVAGAAGMRFWPFIIANTLGLLPLIVISTYSGDALFEKYSWVLQVLLVLTAVYVVHFLLKALKKS